MSQGVAWSTCEASEDDETGHAMLFCPRVGTAGWGDTAAEWLSRGVGSGWIRPRELFRARVDHQAATEEALDGMVPESVLATRRREVQLDYASWIREIVAAEDRWEREYEQRARGGRMTRNSGGRYERCVGVGAAARGALERTVLGQAGTLGLFGCM